MTIDSTLSTLALPDWFRDFRAHQITAIEEILDAYRSGASVVVLDAPTGCLTGDTEISINRGGKGMSVPLSVLVTCFNGGKREWISANGGTQRKGWNLNIETQVQCEVEGYMRLVPLSAAWSSGIQEVYKVQTIERAIRATNQHPFLTPEGFVTLEHLSPSDLVLCRGVRVPRQPAPKKQYRYVAGLKSHPYHTHPRDIGKGEGWRVPTHRLVAEARLNQLRLDDYLAFIRANLIDGLVFLDTAIYAIHHLNGNSLDNRPENLEVLLHNDHWQLEGQNHTWKNVAIPVTPDKIVSIEKVGEELTYDLRTRTDPHNYVANGFVVHNSGKTLIAEAVRQALGHSNRDIQPSGQTTNTSISNSTNGNRNKTAYICSTKSLQSQFIHDYPYARLLKGRANYPTELYPEQFTARWDGLSCDDCTKNITGDNSCKYCFEVASCPYEVAKQDALDADLAVLNTSYFLTEANYIGKFSRRNLVIADECDLLDEAVTGFVAVEISAKRVKELGIGVPRHVTKQESWEEWAESAEPTIREAAKAARNLARQKGSPQSVRKANSLSSLARRMSDLNRGLKEGGWVYTGTRERVEFKPVWADQVAKEALWSHGKKWLLMSATVVNAESLLWSLGYDEAIGFIAVTVPSTFPVENRPIYVRPVANMKSVRDNGQSSVPAEELQRLIPALTQIAEDHPGERILVHTHSYALTRYLMENLASLQRPKWSYADSSQRDGALASYLSTPNSILFAPSLDRGVDLPGDACRVQVVAKIPFPYLGDKRVSARLYGSGSRGQLDYTVSTIRTLVQMTGRGVRSEDDRCVTYILDRAFEQKLWGSNRRLFPKWWRDALKWRA